MVKEQTLNTSCIILAGGKSLRLGYPKASATIGNKSLLERSVALVSPLCDEIIIVSAPHSDFPQIAGNPKVRMAEDTYLNQGPMAGVHAGLSASHSFQNLVIACDMPFLRRSLLRYMVQISPGFDLVIPRVDNLVEMLHAVYTKDCLVVVEKLLKQGVRQVNQLLHSVKVRYVEKEELGRFDPELMSFFNINTPEDLELARELA